MTLQQLHYAITIAEAGSLNKAAEALYISQPSLTSAMQELEKELGFDLCKKREGCFPDAGRIGISSLCKRGVWAV